MKSPQQGKVVSVSMPGSVALYDEITKPPSRAALTNQGVRLMKHNINLRLHY